MSFRNAAQICELGKYLREKNDPSTGYPSQFRSCAIETKEWTPTDLPPKPQLHTIVRNIIAENERPNIVVVIGDRRFSCHMSVLQCYSNLFIEMSYEVIVKLPEKRVSQKAFEIIYQWMMSDEPVISREAVLEVFEAANFLRIKTLIDQCWTCIDSEYFRENSAYELFLEGTHLYSSHEMKTLRKLLLTKVQKFFLSLVVSKEFQHIPRSYIVTLLSSNHIGVHSEIDVFVAAVHWLSCNWETRTTVHAKVMNCVRFSLLPWWLLMMLFGNRCCPQVLPLIDQQEVRRYINEGITYNSSIMSFSMDSSSSTSKSDGTYPKTKEIATPKPRQWIKDSAYNFFEDLEDAFKKDEVSYEYITTYLAKIRAVGSAYWKSLTFQNRSNTPVD